MSRTVAREASTFLIVGGLFLVGSAVGGAIGGVIGGVAGEMLAGTVEKNWVSFRDRFLSEQGIREPDLQAAMRRAYLQAIGNLERRWIQLCTVESSKRTSTNDGSSGFFQMLKTEAVFMLNDAQIQEVVRDQDMLTTLGSGTEPTRVRLRSLLDSLLRLYDEGFRTFVVKSFESELTLCFAEELKSERPEGSRAWRSFQRLVLEDLQENLSNIQHGQSGIGSQLEDMSQILRDIQSWASRLDSQSADIREKTGESVLDVLIVESRDLLLKTIQTESEDTRNSMAVHAHATQSMIDLRSKALQEKLETVHDDLLQIRESSRRPRAIGDTGVLLRGPIRSLGLQSDLERADALTDRIAAADEYHRLAAILSGGGYTFHARLLKERLAEALLEGGAIEQAFAAWLDEAAAALEAGELWIPTYAKQGLEAHRQSVDARLAARADALEGLEGWYEHPDASVRVLQRALEVLDGCDDPWTPRVALWLAERTLVDEGPANPAYSPCQQNLERFFALADEPTSVRLRLVIAESSGDWPQLSEEASTGQLTSADAGLVLCRHGRWLALHAEPEEAIAEYRRAIDKLGSAEFLGDAAGALRSIATIQLRLVSSGNPIEFSNLAKMVENEPSRFERRRNARVAGLESLYSKKWPDALRSLRRYLWEARILGHLHSEIDARGLLAGLYEATNQLSDAVRHYVQAGERKRAEAIAKRIAPVNLDKEIGVDVPWMVGAALGVIAAQSDLLSRAQVEAIAPRLIELTEGGNLSASALQVTTAAWSALAGVSLELPMELVSQVLDRLEPQIERPPYTSQLNDNSLLEILMRFYHFQRSARPRVQAVICHATADPNLAVKLRRFLTRVIDSDDVLRTRIIELAVEGNEVALEVLADSRICLPAVSLRAEQLAKEVLNFEIGVERTEFVLSELFEKSAVFARCLDESMREQLGLHMLAISQDRLAPEPIRSSAVDALGFLASELSDNVRGQMFDAVISLVQAPPSTHPIDLFTQQSLHPFSRFRIDQRALGLPIAALRSSGSLAISNAQTKRLIEMWVAQLQGEDEKILIAGIQGLGALDPAIRPISLLETFASHPRVEFRQLAASWWADGPFENLGLGLRLAQDGGIGVRLAVARAIPGLAETSAEAATLLGSYLARDPSARVRRKALRNY